MAARRALDARFPDLRGEVAEVQARFPQLADDDCFCAWFIHAYLVESEDQAVGAVTGAAKDKGIDAIWIDENADRVFVVQGKYRQSLSAKAESRNDLLQFASLAHVLLGDSKAFSDFLRDVDPLVGDKAKIARERCLARRYKLDLYYVTTGRCSAALEREARARAGQGTGGRAALSVFDGRRVVGVLDDYLDGVAPPVPSADLPLDITPGGLGIVARYDAQSGIESWVFAAKGSAVAELFKQAGVRIFARNVRGFLGSTAINRAMTATLEDRPGYFLYFNNGVTIVCDEAEKVDSKGTSVLRIANPQIINGQQTTRILAAEDKRAEKATVLVRVIRIPRGEAGSRDRFEQLVSQIVEATNWQNEIRASDLMSNDRQQIILEREFRKLGYQYLRKRQTKREARRAAGSQTQFIVKKDEIAQAVAACELDPVVVRGGKEGLFEERHYKAVFPNGNPDFYLTRYWLMRAVSYHARGNPERTYAKWVVLNFLWGELAGDIRRRARDFRTINERPRTHPDAIGHLDRLIERVLRAAVKFYRAERGKGSSALDPSAFFNSQGRGQQFEKFWIGDGNPHRAPFETARAAFLVALADADN
jgi:hypothetical protein